MSFGLLIALACSIDKSIYISNIAQAASFDVRILGFSFRVHSQKLLRIQVSDSIGSHEIVLR